jgi:stage V sporulation protein AE
MQQTIMSYLNAFLVGGAICAVGQVLIDKTKLTSARILVLFVTTGVILTGLGIYQKLVDIGGAGATVPLTGFGYNLAKGTFKDVDKYGLLGAFTGGISTTAAGVAAAVFFGYLAAVAFKPKPKS